MVLYELFVFKDADKTLDSNGLLQEVKSMMSQTLFVKHTAIQEGFRKSGWSLENYIFKETIKLMGIKVENIAQIKPAFFKIDANWYTELGVAGSYHPTPRSLGFKCISTSGETFSVQLISYYDFNPKQTHYEGALHWNNGGRIIDRCGEAHLVRELKGIPHVLKDYPWIKWTMIPGPDGSPKTVEIKRPDKPVT